MSIRDDSDEFFSDNETGETLIAAHRAHGALPAMAPTPTASSSASARKGPGAKKRPHSPVVEHDAGAILNASPKRAAMQTPLEGSGETGTSPIRHENAPETLVESGGQSGDTLLASKPDKRSNALLSPDVIRFFRNM
ncbi:UNVERIFIED_CONTAM: hypothetical protein K2H54_066012, partial [Gekko kuhli]